MTSEDATYMLLGIENQVNVHYAMPVRAMVYDALNYSSQVEITGKKHRKIKTVKGNEFLSGFKKTDKIKPVFTLVIYWGTKEWDAPKTLYEMMDVKEEMSEIIRRFVNDYQVHVIIPNEIENFEWFKTELGYCFRYIRSSTKRESLEKLLKDYREIYSNFDKISGFLLETVTDTKLPKSAVKEESINMCKAIEEMMESAEAKGAEKSAKIFFENEGTMEMAIKVFPMLTEEELFAIKETCN